MKLVIVTQSVSTEELGISPTWLKGGTRSVANPRASLWRGVRSRV